VEDPVRTAEHLARLKERREALQRTCEALPDIAGPFVWEVGCGNGHFLTAFAAAHPDRACVGIDINRERIERSVRKRDRAGLVRLHFLRAEARDFLEALPAAARFSAIYILFPDPWPKRRHQKNRLIDGPFLAAVAKRAGKGARLYFRTDYEPYYSEVAQTIRAHPAWDTCPSAAWPLEIPTLFQQRARRYHSLTAERT
jgi:tRNA (guanine-N7-)-methyltransferase